MVKNVGTKTIETERLILRQLQLSDAEDMFNNFTNNENVSRFLSWNPHENIEVTKNLLINWVDDYKNDNKYFWAIVLKENQQVIGTTSVVELSIKDQKAELGYCIGENYWGRGIVTELTKAVIAFLFNEVGVHRIEAKHDTKNPASGRVMEKVGMKYEGTMRHARFNKGAWCDTKIYAIIRDDLYSDNPLVNKNHGLYMGIKLCTYVYLTFTDGSGADLENRINNAKLMLEIFGDDFDLDLPRFRVNQYSN